MSEHLLIGLASIVLLGMAAQWLAWRLRFPSILLLLIVGFAAGPLTGLIHPDEVFGELLLPVVSIAVGLILFEGGLSLRLSELKTVGRVVMYMVSLGVLVTWVLTACAARYLLGLQLNEAFLLGALLVVTGPTVIGPLLRQIRPKGAVGSILKWEGIAIDPVGAALAVLVFQAITSGRLDAAIPIVVFGIFKTLFAGAFIGGLTAGLLIVLLKHYWIPDYLENGISLAFVVIAFTASNLFQPESGLLTVTLMGIILANQKWVAVRHLIEFKESLRVLLLSCLFIVLAARINLEQLGGLGLNSLAFLAALILIIRPASVFLCTLRSGLTWKERAFVGWMAPRGVVSASMASVFALRLLEEDLTQSGQMVSITFLVIGTTVLVYGLSAGPLARKMKLSVVDPQGLLIVGAHPLARQIAQTLQAEGIKTLLVDSNWNKVRTARMEGLDSHHGDVLSEHIIEEIDLSELGSLIALTSSDQTNALAALHLAPVFGRTKVYQLPPSEQTEPAVREAVIPRHLRGRILFGPEVTYSSLTNRMARGAEIKTTKLSETFDYDQFQEQHNNTAVPLFIISESGRLQPIPSVSPPAPQPDQKLISLVDR